MTDPKNLAAAIERLEAAARSSEKQQAILDQCFNVPPKCSASVSVRDLRTVLDAIKELQEKRPC